MIRTAFAWAAALCVAVTVQGCGDIDSETTELSGALHSAETRFFIPAPNPGAVNQIAALVKARDLPNALRLAAMVATPQAVWFTGGTPGEVQKAVKKVMAAAALEKRVPVLVAYNLPFRDCAQYSAGGAVDTAAYQAWIDGFAKGIRDGKAVVILEPDGLGIMPYNITIYGARTSGASRTSRTPTAA